MPGQGIKKTGQKIVKQPSASGRGQNGALRESPSITSLSPKPYLHPDIQLRDVAELLARNLLVPRACLMIAACIGSVVRGP